MRRGTENRRWSTVLGGGAGGGALVAGAEDGALVAEAEGGALC